MRTYLTILLLLVLAINSYCQQVQWSQVDSVEAIKNIHYVNGNLVVFGFDDTCFTNNPTIININASTGVQNNATIFGDRWCSFNFNPEIRDSYRFGDTILYSFRMLDSINNFHDVIIRRDPNSTLDTLFTTNIGIWRVSAFSGQRILGFDNNRVFLSDQSGNVLGQFSAAGTGWTEIAASAFNERYYAFSVQNPSTGNNAIVSVCLDSNLNAIAYDTIDPGNGVERVDKVLINPNNSNLYLINTAINPGRLSVYHLDSLAHFGAGILLGNFRYVNAVIDNSGSNLFVCGVHAQTLALKIFKFSLNNFSLIDSVIVSGMSQANKVQMEIAPDNSIYITNKSNTSIVEVSGITNNLQVFGTIQLMDTNSTFNTVGGIAAGGNGRLWAGYSGGFMQGSLLFHVDFGALSVNNYTTTCNSAYQVTQNEFYSGAQVGCKPIQLQVNDIAGRSIFEEVQPNQFSFTPKATGIYIVTVNFENGEVKREKVFLTGN